jgi:hypothetical protein
MLSMSGRSVNIAEGAGTDRTKDGEPSAYLFGKVQPRFMPTRFIHPTPLT